MSNIVKINNKEWHKQQIKNQKCLKYYNDPKGKAAMPHTICLSVNNKCFMRCRMCDIGDYNRTQKKNPKFFLKRVSGEEKFYQLPIDTIKRMIDELQRFKPVIRPNFVEPLLRKDILDIGEYVRTRNLEFHIITNGYLLPEKAEGLVEIGTKILRVSIDGLPDIHNQIRGIKNSFEKAIQGIQKVIYAKKKQKKSYPLIGVCYTISDINYDNIVDFFQFLAQENLTKDVYVAFNYLKYNTKEEANMQNQLYGNLFPLTESSIGTIAIKKINPLKLWKQISTLIHKFPPHKFKYHFNPFLNREEIAKWFDGKTFLYPDSPCYAPWTVAQIFYDGSVGVNGRCISPSFGNILEKSFAEIWNSEEAMSFRRKIRENPNLPACNRCSRTFNKKQPFI